MIKTFDRVVNQLLAVIYIDKTDPSVMRIGFDRALEVLFKYDIVVPPKVFEATFVKLVEERLVGKIQANDVAKWAIAQAMLNTALSLSISKEELLRLRLKDNTVQRFDKK